MRKLLRPGVRGALALLGVACAGAAGAGPSHTVDLATVDPADGGLRRVFGSAGLGSRGVPVAGGFDCNDDGHVDYGFSAMTADPAGRTDAGEAYLVFGDGTLAGTIETAGAHPDVLHVIGGAPFENTGTEVWMGEVTGDGAGSGALHEVTLEGGGRYILEVTGGGFHTHVAVSTATGAIVAEGAAAHGRGVRLEIRPADTGAHRVLVTGRDGNARGGYVVAVRQAPPATSIAQTIVPRPPTSEQTADLGQTHQGELTVADAPDRGRPAARCHVYRLNMQRRQTYRIELESPEFAAYLRLEDEAGRQLAVNDDPLPGQSRGAAIQFSPRKDVNCRIVVTTFLEGSTGPYSLRVVKAPARK